MKQYKIFLLTLFAVLLLPAFASGHSEAAEADKEQEVIIVYKNKSGKQKAVAESTEVDHQFKTIPAISVSMDAKSVTSLKEDMDIAYIEENATFRLMDSAPIMINETELQQKTQNTSSASNLTQWGLQAVKADTAFKQGLTGKNIKIAVIDTGIESHPDLEIAGGTSMVAYTSSFNDDNGHGTHVAGIIGARKNNIGITGVAPEAGLYAVKTMNQKGEGSLVDIAEGIDWSISNGMNIINLSLGTVHDSKLIRDLVSEADSRGIALVGAGGNSGTASGTGNSVNFPAKYSKVIAVSAVNKEMQRGDFSSVGEEIDFAAPGIDIASTYRNGGYARIKGTSQALSPC